MPAQLYEETCPLCKGVVWHRSEPCNCVRTNAVSRVVHAADRLNDCMGEFPNDLGAWSEYVEALDDSLRKCPGTRAHALASQFADQARTVAAGAASPFACEKCGRLRVHYRLKGYQCSTCD